MSIGEITGSPAWVIPMKFWKEGNVYKGSQTFNNATLSFTNFTFSYDGYQVFFVRSDGHRYNFKLLANGILSGQHGPVGETTYPGRWLAVRGF